jgi:hypothetical protein
MLFIINAIYRKEKQSYTKTQNSKNDFASNQKSLKERRNTENKISKKSLLAIQISRCQRYKYPEALQHRKRNLLRKKYLVRRRKRWRNRKFFYNFFQVFCVIKKSNNFCNDAFYQRVRATCPTC